MTSVRVPRLLDKIFVGILRLGAGLSGLLLGFMLLVMVAHVIGRYFFLCPIPWAVEFSEYFLVMIIFLSAPWILKAEGHVAIDVLTIRLARRPRALLDSVTSWIMTAVFLSLTYWGSLLTYKDFARGYVLWKTVLTPVWILDIFVPISCFLLAIQSSTRALRFWRLAKKTTSEDSE